MKTNFSSLEWLVYTPRAILRKPMHLTTSRKRLVLALASVGLLLSSLAFVFTRTSFDVNSKRAPGVATRKIQMPRVVLWAWERRSDLSFINPNEVGVAFLARTLYLRDNKVIVRPRLQPLNVPSGAVLTAVARVESDRAAPPRLSEFQREELVSALCEMATLPGIAAVQIDFDAKQSERAFYRQLIADVRRRLPAQVVLSITALSSWCAGDDWLSDLPIDDAVPMLFRMGPDARQVLAALEGKKEFAAAPCRNSYGIATDEPIEHIDASKRLYIFSPKEWTKESLATFLDRARR